MATPTEALPLAVGIISVIAGVLYPPNIVQMCLHFGQLLGKRLESSHGRNDSAPHNAQVERRPSRVPSIDEAGSFDESKVIPTFGLDEC